jgi:hypothetical protein
MPRLWIVACCLVTIACDKPSPAPPIVTPPPTPETINGTERLGWDQPAADAVELATIGYVVYVDGVRTELTGASCGTASSAAFPCTARVPTLPAGAHVLELASFVNDDGIRESARSAPLRVIVVTQTATGDHRAAAAARTGIVTEGLESPTDFAFAPDGRLFVAERRGRVRIVREDRLASEVALSLADTLGASGELLALALDPQFEQTRRAFAIYTEPSRAGGLTFTLARFREVAGTLGDRAVLLDGVPAAAPSPTAALRVGPDARLYAAFDDGGDPRMRRDPASLNGKIVRLELDGTTPRDSVGATPVYADGLQSPVAIDWDPSTGTLWVADRGQQSSRFVFYHGTRFPAWAGRLVSTSDPMFGGRATVVAVGPDGGIYFGTAGAIGRLWPDRAP